MLRAGVAPNTDAVVLDAGGDGLREMAALGLMGVNVPPDLGGGRFHWTDANGSELTWQTVGKFADGLVWYATGKVKPGTLLPMVPVKAVAVLRHPSKPARCSADPDPVHTRTC